MASKLNCKVCGISIPYRSPDAYDDRCDDCIEREERWDYEERAIEWVKGHLQSQSFAQMADSMNALYLSPPEDLSGSPVWTAKVVEKFYEKYVKQEDQP